MTETRNYPAKRARPVKAEDQAAVARMERDLVTVAKRKARSKAADDAVAAERDRVIRDAHAIGVTPSRIAELTGLTVQRVAQIRREE